MTSTALSSLKTHFGQVRDPRVQHSIDHLLVDIMLVTICAVICGADSWVEVENYGLAKQEWLATFLELPHGIPSHDTIERLFIRLRPAELQQCFISWVQSVFEISGGQLIAVDGKTLRGSYERGGKRAMIHMVSAWATQNRIVLGQCKVNNSLETLRCLILTVLGLPAPQTNIISTQPDDLEQPAVGLQRLAQLDRFRL